MGSFVILSGALVNVVAGEKRSMPGRKCGEIVKKKSFGM